MIYPAILLVEPPNEDLDPNVKKDYLEAAQVLSLSPRSSAALLRLALQKMCDGQLTAEGENLNEQIGDLVSKGLSVKVQQSLDSLRVIGNEAVHPGTLDLRDDVSTATALFSLINYIADQLISLPKQIEALYGKIPIAKLDQIEARDQ